MSCIRLVGESVPKEEEYGYKKKTFNGRCFKFYKTKMDEEAKISLPKCACTDCRWGGGIISYACSRPSMV